MHPDGEETINKLKRKALIPQTGRREKEPKMMEKATEGERYISRDQRGIR